MPQISALRYYRKKNHLTVQKLSAEVHIPADTLKDWECLHRTITPRKALILAQYFKIDPLILQGKQVIQISVSEYNAIYRPNSVYIPSEIKVHDKHKRLMDMFLYGKRALPKNNRGWPTTS